jgi:AcrR family transcriptional regulator
MKAQTVMKPAKADPARAERSSDARCARDRIFETARELFYKQGIRAVGVETIANEAGTTKMSLYRHFPSKDELTAECLKADRAEFDQWWNETIARAGTPRKQLEALFSAFQSDICEDEEGRGCPLANAAVELSDPKHPARKVVLEHKSEVRKRLRDICREMSARRPEKLGDALFLLMEGTYMARIVFGVDGPGQVVLKAANALIDAERAAS